MIKSISIIATQVQLESRQFNVLKLKEKVPS